MNTGAFYFCKEMIVMQTANNNTAQKEAAANTVEAAKSTAAGLFRKLRTVGAKEWTRCERTY